MVPAVKFDINVIGSREAVVLRANVYTQKWIGGQAMWSRDLYYDFSSDTTAQRLINETLGFYMELKTTPLKNQLDIPETTSSEPPVLRGKDVRTRIISPDE
jgi:hypothetical protein